MSPISVSRDGAIATIVMNRPDMLNALGAPGDGEMVAEACREINADRSVRCAILTGAGRAFSAGGDIKAMHERRDAFGGDGYALRDTYRRNIHQIVRSLYNLEVPLIAAVNGPAVGLGCDVACMADIRVAGRSARFGVTFLKIGLIPGDGGAWLLPRTIGASRAAQLLFTGDMLDAATALDWGLVSEVVDDDALIASARAIAERIIAQPRDALRMAKTLLRQGQHASFDTIMEMSAAAQALAHLSEDHHEGVAAMVGKRSPSFPSHDI